MKYICNGINYSTFIRLTPIQKEDHRGRGWTSQTHSSLRHSHSAIRSVKFNRFGPRQRSGFSFIRFSVRYFNTLRVQDVTDVHRTCSRSVHFESPDVCVFFKIPMFIHDNLKSNIFFLNRVFKVCVSVILYGVFFFDSHVIVGNITGLLQS